MVALKNFRSTLEQLLKNAAGITELEVTLGFPPEVKLKLEKTAFDDILKHDEKIALAVSQTFLDRPIFISAGDSLDLPYCVKSMRAIADELLSYAKQFSDSTDRSLIPLTSILLDIQIEVARARRSIEDLKPGENQKATLRTAISKLRKTAVPNFQILIGLMKDGHAIKGRALQEIEVAKLGMNETDLRAFDLAIDEGNNPQ